MPLVFLKTIKLYRGHEPVVLPPAPLHGQEKIFLIQQSRFIGDARYKTDPGPPAVGRMHLQGQCIAIAHQPRTMRRRV